MVLTVDGIKPSLDGVIARSDQNGTLITFKITEATGKLVEDLVGGAAAPPPEATRSGPDPASRCRQGRRARLSRM